MKFKELKKQLEAIPTDFDEYEVSSLFNDYEIDNFVKEVDVAIFMNANEIRLTIKR